MNTGVRLRENVASCVNRFAKYMDGVLVSDGQSLFKVSCFHCTVNVISRTGPAPATTGNSCRKSPDMTSLWNCLSSNWSLWYV